MVTLKNTRFDTQLHVIVAIVETNKISHPRPIEDDPIIVTSLIVLVQQDLVPLRVNWGTFQALQFFQPLQQLCQGQLLYNLHHNP